MLRLIVKSIRKTMSLEAKSNNDTSDSLDETDNHSKRAEIRSSTLSLIPLPPPLRRSLESTRSVSVGEESVEAINNEEERANYFLQYFSDIPTAGNSECGYGESLLDDLDDDSISSFEGDHNHDEQGDVDEENTRQNSNSNESQGGFETILVETNDSNTTLVVPALMNDYEVLQDLRATLYGIDQRSTDDTAFGSNDGTEEDQVEQRTTDHFLYERQIQQESAHRDPMVAFFFKFFEFAQAERLKGDYVFPYFILNLFNQLSNIRSDLEWAQDAAYRKQTGKPYISWADYYAKDRFQSWFTYAMQIVITFTMLWAFYLNDWKAEPMGDNVAFGPSQDVLLKLGALRGEVLVEDGKWWLLVTPIFLHSGVIHFTLNSVLFFVLCRTIERNHGWLHTALLFLSSGVVGNMISATLQPMPLLVGSSGGIFGLLGACLGDIVLNSRFFFLVLEERAQKETLRQKRKRVRRRLKRKMKRQNGSQPTLEGGSSTRTTLSNEARARDVIFAQAYDMDAVKTRRRWVRFWCYTSVVFDLLLNLSLGLLPFVDNFAHLGGLLFGFFASLSSLRLLSASPFDYGKKQHKTTLKKWFHRLRILALRCGGGLAALCLVCAASFALRRSDGINSPCPSCRYISCIALPKPWKPNDPNNWWTCDGCDNADAVIHWGRTGVDFILTHADIDCPMGDTIRVDISEHRYGGREQVIQALPHLCRSFCNEF